MDPKAVAICLTVSAIVCGVFYYGLYLVSGFTGIVIFHILAIVIISAYCSKL